MSHKTTEYRGIEIRYGRNLLTHRFRARFVLPPGHPAEPDFERDASFAFTPAIEPGTSPVDADTEDGVLTRALAQIDSNLGSG